jgi:nucleotide-sensitive chloride channel 1A
MTLTTIHERPSINLCKHEENDVDIFFNSVKYDQGPGTLYILPDQVLWWTNEHSCGFSIYYPSIIMHAISRDTREFDRMCIYCQVEAEAIPQEYSENENAKEEEKEELTIVMEIRLAPRDCSRLDEIFNNMSECSALHPDQDEMSDDDEGHNSIGIYLFLRQ